VAGTKKPHTGEKPHGETPLEHKPEDAKLKSKKPKYPGDHKPEFGGDDKPVSVGEDKPKLSGKGLKGGKRKPIAPIFIKGEDLKPEDLVFHLSPACPVSHPVAIPDGLVVAYVPPPKGTVSLSLAVQDVPLLKDFPVTWKDAEEPSSPLDTTLQLTPDGIKVSTPSDDIVIALMDGPILEVPPPIKDEEEPIVVPLSALKPEFPLVLLPKVDGKNHFPVLVSSPVESSLPIDSIPLVAIIEQPLHSIIPGQPFSLIVVTLDDEEPVKFGGCKLEVELEGVDEIPIGITDHGDGTYGIHFAPPDAKPRNVIVLVDGVPAKNSPFELPVPELAALPVNELGNGDYEVSVPALLDDSPVALAVLVDGVPVTDAPLEVVPNTLPELQAKVELPEHISFDAPIDIPVTFVDEEGKPQVIDNLSIIEVSPSTDMPVSISPDPENPEKVDIRFDPTSLDKKDFSFDISVNGEPILDAPIKVVESPKVTGIPESGPAFVPISFLVDAQPSLPIEIEITDPDRVDSFPVILQPLPDGKTSALFLPKEPGQYLFHVNIDGKPVAGSPFTVEVLPVKAKLEGKHLEGTKDNRTVLREIPFTFTVQLETSEGPIGVSLPPNTFAVRIYGEKSRLPAKVTPDQNRPGLYEIQFTPKVSGPYKIDLLLYDEKLLPQPKEVWVILLPFVKPLDKKKIYARLHVPVEVVLPLLALDGSPLPLKDIQVSASGPEGDLPIKIAVDPHAEVPNSVYLLDLAPEAPGVYNVSPLIEGYPMFEEPISVVVVDEVSPADSEVKIESPTVEVGFPVKVSVTTKDKFGNVVPFPVEGLEARLVPTKPVFDDILADEPVLPDVTKFDEGVYSQIFIPTTPCVYDLVVFLNGEKVGDTPLPVTVTEKADRTSRMILETVLTVKIKVFAMTKSKTKNKGGDDVQIKVIGQKVELKNLTVTDNQDGTYTVAFTHVYGVGEFEVRGYLNGEPVDGGPLYYYSAQPKKE